MRRLLVLLVAALCLSFAADGHAQPPRHRRRHHSAARAKKKRRHHRARRPVRTVTPLASESDELVLSPALLEQLQRNLTDGGYPAGPANGHMTRQTRRALADFQRDYHLPPTGTLDVKTADALLGYEVIAAYTATASR